MSFSFSRVLVSCPACGAEHELLSFARGSVGAKYIFPSVPITAMAELDRQAWCCGGCGERWEVRVTGAAEVIPLPGATATAARPGGGA